MLSPYLQDMVFSFVCAALIFCGAVALATYIPRWQSFLNGDPVSEPTINRIIGAAGAAAVSY